MKKAIIFLMLAVSIFALGDAGRILLNNKKTVDKIKGLKTEIAALDKKEKETNDTLVKLEEENKALRSELSEQLANKKVVYLTFDDGPTPQNTEKILAILKKNNIKGTFFVIGHNSDMYKRIVEEGHTIALHTYSHNYKEVYASEEAFFKDLYKIHDAVMEKTGVDAKVTRFPGGSSNAIVKKATLRKIIDRLNDEGFVYQDWNCDRTDAAGNKRPVDVLVKNATSCNATKINLLMHDSAAKVTTADALQSIIDSYRSRGYDFEELTVYSPKFQHRK